MHPITPVVKGWKILVAVLAIIAYNAADEVQQIATLLGGRTWLVILALFAVVVLVGLGYSALSWRVTRYAITDDAVHLRTGVVFRRQRQARLDRLQAVDVVQPLLARLLGFSELRLEVAGGAGSAVSLAFLRDAQAEQLRAELLTRAAGLYQGNDATGAGAGAGAGGVGAVGADEPTPVTDSPFPGVPVAIPADQTPATAASTALAPAVPAPTAPERPVYSVPTDRLIVSTLLSSALIVLVVLLVALIVVMIVSRSVGPVVAFLPILLVFGSLTWGRFNRSANFRAAISPDGIRLRHGLTEMRAQTVPPGRVQAVRISQGLLWRRRDWWRVEVNVAGYAQAEDGSQPESVLLPVGTRDDVMLALWLVLPDAGTADPRALVEAAMVGTTNDQGFLTAPRRSRWLDPVSWRRHGVAVTDSAMVMRSGRLLRSVMVVPHERTQSLALVQGPLERAMGLASFEVHSTQGPVSPVVHHLDQRVAAGLMDEQATRARRARAGAGPEMWMARP